MSALVFEMFDWNIYCRVSSTLDKSVGKKYLIDNSPETCWTSQQVSFLWPLYFHESKPLWKGLTTVHPIELH